MAKSLLELLQGTPDARSPVGMLSRGANVYNSGFLASNPTDQIPAPTIAGGTPQQGTPKPLAVGPAQGSWGTGDNQLAPGMLDTVNPKPVIPDGGFGAPPQIGGGPEPPGVPGVTPDPYGDIISSFKPISFDYGNKGNFDPAYDAAVQQIQNQLAQYDYQIRANQRGIENQYTQGNQGLQENLVNSRSNLAASMSDRGLARSGINVGERGKLEESGQKQSQSFAQARAQQLADLRSQYSLNRTAVQSSLAGLQAQKAQRDMQAAIDQANNEAKARAQQDYLARLQQSTLEASQPKPTPTGALVPATPNQNSGPYGLNQNLIDWRKSATDKLWAQLGGNAEGTGTVGQGASKQDIANHLFGALSAGKPQNKDQQYWWDMAIRANGKAPGY